MDVKIYSKHYRRGRHQGHREYFFFLSSLRVLFPRQLWKTFISCYLLSVSVSSTKMKGKGLGRFWERGNKARNRIAALWFFHVGLECDKKQELSNHSSTKWQRKKQTFKTCACEKRTKKSIKTYNFIKNPWKIYWRKFSFCVLWRPQRIQRVMNGNEAHKI